MPEVNAPQQQPAMEMESTSSGVVSQQPMPEAQMDTEMSLRGGCQETIGCCGDYETCECCCG